MRSAEREAMDFYRDKSAFVDSRLDTVERALLQGGTSRTDRRSILEDIETQILEMRRNGTDARYWQQSFGKRPAEELYDLRSRSTSREFSSAPASDMAVSAL